MALPNIMVNDGTGTLRRAVATSDIQGTIEFQDNVNSTNAYVTTPDGEKHRVVLVANLGGSGGGSGSGDVTSVNGKTGAVTLTGNDINSTITGNGSDVTDTVTNHLQTLKNDQEANGTQIHEIEAKIPQSATETNQLTTKEDLPEAKTGTAGQVYTKTADGAAWQDAAGGGSSADNNGLEGDYCSKYGIVDETSSGLPTQGTGNQIIIPAQLVMDVPGVAGLTQNGTKITHDLVSTTNCEIFLAEGTVIEATETYWQTTEPEDGQTGYLAWWNGTEWKFKSNDTGNVWRAANAVRIAKCIFTDGALTRLCFTGCRVLNKQEWLPKSGGALNKGAVLRFNAAAGGFYSEINSSAAHPLGFRTVWPNLSTGEIYFDPTPFAIRSNKAFNIGSNSNIQGTFYFKNINNGADIDIPTTGGTMIVATPPTTAGNYVLKATVAEDGTVTTQWVVEA